MYVVVFMNWYESRAATDRINKRWFYLLLLKLFIHSFIHSLIADARPQQADSGYHGFMVWDFAIPKTLEEFSQKNIKHQDSFGVCLSGLIKVIGSVKSRFKFRMHNFSWAFILGANCVSGNPSWLPTQTEAFHFLTINIYNFIVNIKTLSKLLKTVLCACVSVCSRICVCACAVMQWSRCTPVMN